MHFKAGIVIAGLGASIVASLATVAACGTSNDAAPAAASDAAARPDDMTAAASRAACRYKRGALPSQTLGSNSPLGTDIPIDTIVVLMQENRSFDSYFSHLGRYAGRTDIESAPDSTSNPTSTGSPVPYEHAAHMCLLDTNHEWSGRATSCTRSGRARSGATWRSSSHTTSTVASTITYRHHRRARLTTSRRSSTSVIRRRAGSIATASACR